MQLSPAQIDRALALKSLAEFSRQAWPVLEPSTPLEWNWHLDAICDHVQAVLEDWMAAMVARREGRPQPVQRIQNLVINVPPGTGKSRFVSVFAPAWMWLHWPGWRAIFVSGNPRVSLRDADYCRTLVESDWYCRTFAVGWRLAKDQNAKSLYRNTAGGFRMSISAGSKLTGDRGDALFVDDPNDAKQVKSDTYRDGINDWWDQGAGNRVNDLRCSVRVLVMQRLHETDLAGHVQKSKQWDALVIPQEFEPDRATASKIGWRDPRRRAGELMFALRFPEAVLVDERLRLGPGYSGQHQQSPTPAGGGKFQKANFRYWHDRGNYYELVGGGGKQAVLKGDCRRFAVMDPAGVEKNANSKACYTVIQVWDVTPRADMLLVHQYREQVETPAAADAAVDLSRNWRPDYLGIEQNGIGLGVVQNVMLRGVAVLPIVARANKDARSDTAEIRLMAGKVYFPHGADYLAELEKELTLFPNGQYVDQVDAFAHAARLVNEHDGPPKSEDDVAWERQAAAGDDGMDGMFANNF